MIKYLYLSRILFREDDNRMITIGDCTIPKYRLGLLLEQTEKLHRKFGTKETNSKAIAETLGYPRRSNPFYAKLKDFESFGLLEGEGRGIRVTELGKKSIQQNNAHKREALEEIIRNIPLWDRLLNEYGTKIDKKGFSERLAGITNVELSEVQKQAEKIRRAYLDDVEYIRFADTSTRLQESQKQDAQTIPEQGNLGTGAQPIISKEATGYIAFPEYHTSIEIKDEISYDLAKQLLDAIGKKLGLVESKKPYYKDE